MTILSMDLSVGKTVIKFTVFITLYSKLSSHFASLPAVGGADIIDMLHPPVFFSRFLCLFMPHAEDPVKRPYDAVPE